MASLDIDFEIQVADIDESFPPEMDKEKVAEFIAHNKWKALQSSAKKGQLTICSDTIVLVDDEILGKPVDVDDAKNMLRKLSGKTHVVISAVAMGDDEKQVTFSDETKVSFNDLSEDEIAYYLKNYNPYDKAGSYGVQEWIGMMGIHRMEGSYFTVMGLPVHRVYEELKNW